MRNFYFFHSYQFLRMTAGIHPKTAQQLMRHSDINLTMSRYTHVLRGQEASAINSLPDIENYPNIENQKATGTDNLKVESDAKKSSAIYSAKSMPNNSVIMQHSAIPQEETRQKESPVSEAKSTISPQKQGFSKARPKGLEPSTFGSTGLRKRT